MNASPYLAATEFIDHQHPAVAAFTARFDKGATDIERAIAVYYGVRDEIFYDPYTARLDRDSFKASTTLAAGRGWCVPKAILLTACYRHMGIPARLGFADVTNHLSTEKMREIMQTDVFLWHGYTSVYLNNKWVKATPAFNLALCEKFHLKPLEFNGEDDSLYHEFDQAGNRHMEYINERGDFDDLPFDALCADFRKHYPNLVTTADLDFDKDVDAEVSRQTGP